MSNTVVAENMLMSSIELGPSVMQRLCFCWCSVLLFIYKFFFKSLEKSLTQLIRKKKKRKKPEKQEKI